VFLDAPRLFAGVVFLCSACSPELRFSCPFLALEVCKLAPFCDCFCAASCAPFVPGISRSAKLQQARVYLQFTQFLRPGCIALCLCLNCVISRLINPCKLVFFLVNLAILVL
jgi:hypothetical protein